MKKKWWRSSSNEKEEEEVEVKKLCENVKYEEEMVCIVKVIWNEK